APDAATYTKRWTPDSDGLWHTVILDMHSLDIGGTDWNDNIILGLEIHPCGNTDVVIDFDYFAMATKSMAMDWRHDADNAYMDGGHIYAGSEIRLNEGGKMILGNNNFVFDTTANAFYIAHDGWDPEVPPTEIGLRYMQMTYNDFKYVYWNGTENEEYSPVRRMETGTGEHGETVSLPGIWLEQPTIYVFPQVIPTYDVSENTADQVIEIGAENIISPSDGHWDFDIQAALRKEEWTEAKVINSVVWESTDQNSSGWQGAADNTHTLTSSAYYPASSGCISVKVVFKLRAKRGTQTYYLNSIGRCLKYKFKSKIRFVPLIDGVQGTYNSYTNLNYDFSWNTYTCIFDFDDATDNYWQIRAQNASPNSQNIVSYFKPANYDNASNSYSQLELQVISANYYYGTVITPLQEGSIGYIAMGE
ncbi:MAG: hypothetical protein DRI71_06785, partial [Bacteroidetes bacterium]